MYQYKEIQTLNNIDLDTRNYIKGLFSKYCLYSAIENNEYKEIKIKEPIYNSLELILKSKNIKLNDNLIVEMARYDKRKNDRKRTTKKRIEKMINLYKQDRERIILFMTFTFDEKHINNTIKNDIRNIKEYFKKQDYIDYLFNIDYGKKYNRKHYHAIAIFNKKIDSSQWKQGNLDFVKIKINSNENALTQYILKLEQHCYKTTTNEKVIYARKKRR